MTVATPRKKKSFGPVISGNSPGIDSSMVANTRSRSTSAEKSLPPSSNEQLVSFNYVKELRSVQESSMKAFLSVFMENCNMRIDNLTCAIAQIKQSLEFTEAQVVKQNDVPTQLAAVSDAV